MQRVLDKNCDHVERHYTNGKGGGEGGSGRTNRGGLLSDTKNYWDWTPNHEKFKSPSGSQLAKENLNSAYHSRLPLDFDQDGGIGKHASFTSSFNHRKNYN